MTQKELKSVYTEELKKAWSTESMVKYCASKAQYIVEHNNGLYSIEKPSIETHFCFGHGFCGVSSQEEEDDANHMAEVAKSDAEYFINENLKSIDGQIDTLKKIKADMALNWAEGSYPRYMVSTCKHYNGQTPDCRLRGFSVVNMYGGKPYGEICKDTELIDKLIEGYEEVRKSFIKRLNIYLKKYGLSKVKSWSYLSD